MLRKEADLFALMKKQSLRKQGLEGGEDDDIFD